MKIMAIVPGALSAQEIAAREDYLRTLCSPSTHLIVVPTESGPAAEDGAALGVVITGILERVRQANEERYDAIMLHCFADPGLEAAKTISDIPFVAPGEANYHVASLLGDKFGLITLTREFVPIMWRRAKIYGVADRIVSIKTLDIPLLEFKERKRELEEKFRELGKGLIGEGAHVIISACLATLPALGTGSSNRIGKDLGIPVLDSNAVTLRVAEMLVSLKVSQSNAAFPRLGHAAKT